MNTAQFIPTVGEQDVEAEDEDKLEEDEDAPEDDGRMVGNGLDRDTS